MYQDILLQAGLTQAEISLYELLLQKGQFSVSEASKNTPLKRGTTYNALMQLEEKGLIERFIDKKKFHFKLAHPTKIRDFLQQKTRQLEDVDAKLRGILPGMISEYNLIFDKPATHFFEGLDGLQRIYRDIIDEKKDLLLIRSILDNNHPEIDKLVQKSIHNQVKKNIHTRAITPLTENAPSFILKKDQEHLVERKIIPRIDLELPAQILIYGDKVAITSFEDSLVTTLIENKSINKTFRILFEYIWKMAEPEHLKIYQKIINNK